MSRKDAVPAVVAIVERNRRRTMDHTGLDLGVATARCGFARSR